MNKNKTLAFCLLLLLVVGCRKSDRAQTQPSGESEPSAQSRREASAALEKLGAEVETDPNGKARSVMFLNAKINDADLEPLKELTNLVHLSIENSGIGLPMQV